MNTHQTRVMFYCCITKLSSLCSSVIKHKQWSNSTLIILAGDVFVLTALQLVMMTPGVLLKKLNGDPQLRQYTHIVIDEVSFTV
jgi:hypothetical protein